MRARSTLWALLFAGAAAVVAAHAAPPAAATSVAHASLVQGSAKLGGRALAKGDAIAEGDAIVTDKGARVELIFVDGSRVRIAGGTQVVVSKAGFTQQKRDDVSLTLRAGRLWAKVAKTSGADANFKVETTNAVAGVRGTSFAVLAAGDASALVRVYSGAVGVRPSGVGKPAERKQVAGPREIDRSQWEEIVATAMKQVRVSAVGELSPAEDFEDTGESLEWAQWNQARDAELGK